ncbi:MAG: glyoxalase [Bradyrhizobiaceae bacterium]|nr:MAG: glyoxalase [Bradyrhizobiaceae bacterium]
MTLQLLLWPCLVTGAPTVRADEVRPIRQVAVGAQYGTTHVYVPEDRLDDFVTSFVATFGGNASPPNVAQITPTPSSTVFRAIRTPAGAVSAFGFTTPIPYPFGFERTGYLVTDIDDAIAAAKRFGAAVLVAPFPDAIGRDAIIQWPGGVNMQLYWHTKFTPAPPLQANPENRLYLPAESADAFISQFIAFSQGTVTSDDTAAPGIEIGRPGDTYRRVRITSPFGNLAVFVIDGHLPYPYGHEMTGYEVGDLQATLDKARAANVKVLVEPFTSGQRQAAMVEFPGGYIAEIHAPIKR